MTERERLQCAYELAFHPPRLHEAWDRIKRDAVGDREQLGQLLDLALLLHQALPEGGYASQRALNRLALYQAKARAFGMVRFLRNIRRHLRRPPLDDRVVPAHLVRDIAVPQIGRVSARKPPKILIQRRPMENG
ncbi:MAG: hypothetical protein HY360_02490 [Verrucomicrobia bacterium]|nr:hypothetical protein [Verrucomicrobiota bacterium]